jgi:NAD(P)-binding Rossmann-like domain
MSRLSRSHATRRSHCERRSRCFRRHELAIRIANMKIEPVHTLILGAGTSGLAAGYALVKAGIKPVILEKDSVPGGLFRSIHRGDFIVDIGRKELYNRIAKVDAFWNELLGGDYREYAHRGGVLFNGHIIDMSPAFRGFRRGMPWRMLLGCGIDFLWSRVRSGKPAPRNVEEYFSQKRGRSGFSGKIEWSKMGGDPDT